MNHDNNNSIVSSSIKSVKNQQSTSWFKKLFNIFKQESKEEVKTNLLLTIDKYRTSHILNEVQKQIMTNTLSFSDLTVGDIMIHRTDIIALEKNITLEELRKIVIESKHTRFPIYEQNLDNIIGFIHIKDIIKGMFDNEISLSKILRPIPSVTLNLPLTDLLVKMRAARVHMAAVIDEYGGVDGLVAFEDVIEEIIGEVYDEHDKELEPSYNIIMDNQLIEASARLPLESLEKLFKIELSKDILEEIDTVGGLILSIMGRIPTKHEKISYENILQFEIMDVDSRTIKWVQITKNLHTKEESL